MKVQVLILGLCFFASGCSEITVHYPHDPGGGALTESVGCLYDFDRAGLWYVVFVHADGLLGAVHRHNPGIHLFVDRGDLLFYVRCSGRNEVIDISGESFDLVKGTIFLCDIEKGTGHVRQLPLPSIACDGPDPQSRSRALAQLTIDPRIAAFLPPEARARLLTAPKTEPADEKGSR